MVGEANMDGDYFLWTHKKIEIGFNGNQVNNTQSCMLKVEVHLHVDNVIMLTLHVYMCVQCMHVIIHPIMLIRN